MNITTEELKTLEACQSNQDWRKACDAIKAVRNQEYPDDWWKRVKQTGLMDRIMQRWEGSSELEVIHPEPSPEDYEPNPYHGTYSEE